MIEQCANCRFGFAEKLANTGMVLCKKYPPAMSTFMNKKGELDAVVGYPQVKAIEWCGQYEKGAQNA